MILSVYLASDGMDSIHTKLTNSAYEVEWKRYPIESVTYCMNNSVSMVIAYDDLDFMRGYQLLAVIKAVRPNIVTVLCSNKVDDALEMNALKARVDTIIDLSRSDRLNWEKIKQCLNDRNIGERIIESNNVCLNSKSYTVTKDGVEIPLTIREFEFLEFFIRNKNRALTRSEIVDALWDPKLSPMLDGRTVDVHVKRIRDKLGKSALVSVRGIGYKWKE